MEKLEIFLPSNRANYKTINQEDSLVLSQGSTDLRKDLHLSDKLIYDKEGIANNWVKCILN